MNRLALLVMCIGMSSAAWGANRGAEVFQLCASCHGTDAHGNSLIGAPSIAGLPAWYISAQLDKFRSGARGKHADDDAGNRMRPLAMTLEPGDVQLVADYVASLPAAKAPPTLDGANPDRGKAKYVAVCTTCHGANGEGNAAVHAPPLNMANDWYLLRQLTNFKKHIRAYDPTDTFGMVMAGQAATFSDEESMKDVVAYIAALDPTSAAVAGPAASTMTMADMPKFQKGSPELVAKGKELFNTNCAVCHGAGGSGDGSGGASLNPKPRDFHAEAAKWTHGNSALSIYYTLAVGSAGTGMAAYRSLPPEDRWALVHYVMSFAPNAARVGKTDAQGMSAAKEDIAMASAAPKETISIDFAIQRMVEEAKKRQSL